MVTVNVNSNFSFSEFLSLASSLRTSVQFQEGALRTAVSRAYYTVFLTVRDKLFGPDGKGLSREVKKRLAKKFERKFNKIPGSHELVLFAIIDLPDIKEKKRITLYQQIDQLKEARVHADYHFSLENLKNIPYDTWAEYAEKMIDLASLILPDAEKLLPYSPSD